MNLTEDLRRRFKTLVADRSGLYFKDHDMRNLQDAVNNRMQALNIPAAASYYQLLITSPERDNEFRDLVNLLTIHHTYFFRNEPHFQILRQKILPEIIAKKKIRAQFGEKPQLRIWSAGCSTGEEAYSIAMVVRDLIEDLSEWDIQILATDAAKDALAKAQRAVYRPQSVKFVSTEHKIRHFKEQKSTASGTEYVLSDEIKRMVTFGMFNLMDENFPLGFDIIFFRNVAIYFELGTTIQVMNRFHGSLADDGYLFIGYSESLQFLRDKFEMFSEDDAIYYRRAKEGVVLAEPSLPKQEWDQSALERVVEEISHHASLKSRVEFPKQEGLGREALQKILDEAEKFILLKDYDRAMDVVESGLAQDWENVELRFLKAEVLSNQGKVREAEVQLHQCLQADAMFVPAHHLLGCISLEQEDQNKARQHFRKAIYLDEGFSLAYFYLAQAYRAMDLPDDAVREYRNALKVLSNQNYTDMISYSGGIDVGTLTNVCRNNLERLKLERV